MAVQSFRLTVGEQVFSDMQRGKDRLATLDSLRDNRPRSDRSNADVEAMLQQHGLSASVRRNLAHLPWYSVLEDTL
ncbi:MAG: hypothetical protein HXY39_03305 [Chloroflexi bacterium]|nr:hypothetical protein [Chloroflexota bacterium]